MAVAPTIYPPVVHCCWCEKLVYGAALRSMPGRYIHQACAMSLNVHAALQMPDGHTPAPPQYVNIERPTIKWHEGEK